MTRLRLALLFAAVIIAAVRPAMAQDENLGRLFYTPKQRTALDANIRSVTKQPEKKAPIPRSVTLSGVVTRSDGERTVWIDGRAYHHGNPDDVTVTIDSSNPAITELKVRGVRKRVPVRVGQKLNPLSGQTLEPYEVPAASVTGQ